MTVRSLIAIGLAAASCATRHAAPPVAAFTYQGEPRRGSAPANGVFDFSFDVQGAARPS